MSKIIFPPKNQTQSQAKQQQQQQQLQQQLQEQQQQEYKQYLAQQQAEIRYYVYQDLQNIINLIYSRKAVLEQFKNEPNHPMITLSNNKLILQLNLSNGIHTDLNQQSAKNQDSYQMLYQERQNAFRILKKVIDKEKEEQWKMNNKQYGNNGYQVNSLDSQLQQYTEQYKNQKFQLNPFQLQQTGIVAKFDENVLAKIVSASQAVDSQIEGLRNGSTYYIPTEEDFIRKAENYYILTQQKLNMNSQHEYKDQNSRQELNFQQQQRGIEVENCQRTNSANLQQTSIHTQNFNNQVDNTYSSKDELIKSLSHFGFFNQDREDHIGWKYVEQQFNKLKYTMNTEKSQEIQTAKEAQQSNETLFYGHYLLHYFFSLYKENETQQQKQSNASYNQKFLEAQKKIDSDKKLNSNFLNYLKRIQDQLIIPYNYFSQNTVTWNHGWNTSNKQECYKNDQRTNGNYSRIEAFSEEFIDKLFQNFNKI